MESERTYMLCESDGKGGYRDIYFIPEDDFEDYFIKIDQKSVKDFYSGGWDSYLQSYGLQNVRSSIRTGEYSSTVLNLYELDLSSESLKSKDEDE